MDDKLSTALVALIAGAIGFAGAIATGWFGFASKDEELRVHLVEIAIGILRADPKEDVAPARSWAIDIIEKNSGVKFNDDDRKALLHKPIVSMKIIGALNGDDYYILPFKGNGKAKELFRKFLEDEESQK